MRRWYLGHLGFVAASSMVLLGSCGGGSGSGGVCTGTFAACGGDPTGTWQVTGLCYEGGLAKSMNDALAASAPSCAGAVQSAELTFSGTVSYQGGTATYDASVTSSGTAFYSAGCMTDSFGATTVDAAACAKLEEPTGGATSSSVNCSFANGGCRCTWSETTPDTSTTSYTVSGSTLVETDGTDSNTYEFCVSGQTMSQRTRLGSGSHAILTLTKR